MRAMAIAALGLSTLTTWATAEEQPYNGIAISAFTSACLNKHYDFFSTPLSAPLEDARRLPSDKVARLIGREALNSDAWEILKTVDGPYLFSIGMSAQRETALSYSGTCHLHSSYIPAAELADFFDQFFSWSSREVTKHTIGTAISQSMILRFDDTNFFISTTYDLRRPNYILLMSVRQLEAPR